MDGSFAQENSLGEESLVSYTQHIQSIDYYAADGGVGVDIGIRMRNEALVSRAIRNTRLGIEVRASQGSNTWRCMPALEDPMVYQDLPGSHRS